MTGQDLPRLYAGRTQPGLVWWRAPCTALLLAAALSVGGCALPSQEGRKESQAISAADGASTRIGRSLAGAASANPGLTGISPLSDARGAFAARMRLVQGAERTIDVQSYIWHKDATGTLLLRALHDAAERGVRVRLLLDDNGTAGLDDALAALDRHPNFEVRLFNPFSVRSPKAIGYLTHFDRANRRMHNKSFTVDNQATIVGGRNIGDEYFGATDDVVFADLDVIAVGAVVPDMSKDFDRYWASLSAYPIDRILASKKPVPLDEALPPLAEDNPQANRYRKANDESRLLDSLYEGKIEFQWSKVRMISDDPRKGLGEAPDNKLMMPRIMQLLDTPRESLDLVSSYFVPAETGTAAFSQLAQERVKVRILTNALEATDVAPVHAGYAKRRKALLEAGVTLYEMRRQPGTETSDAGGPLGSSGSSLHAKTFAVDRKRMFVGSYNFDPRSEKLNTELGFVIDNPKLTSAVHAAFDEKIPQVSYEVRLDDKGDMYWLAWEDGKQVRYDSEPNTGLLKGLAIRVLSWLPIDWLL
jgi:putative cardiolipin synthase